MQDVCWRCIQKLLNCIIFGSTSFICTVLHRTVQCTTRSIPYAYSVQIYWRRLSCIISGSPAIDLRLVAMANSYSCAYFAQSIHFLFSYSFLYREGSSSLGPFLRRVPRSLRGDECYKSAVDLNIMQLNSFGDSPYNYLA